MAIFVVHSCDVPMCDRKTTEPCSGEWLQFSVRSARPSASTDRWESFDACNPAHALELLQDMLYTEERERRVFYGEDGAAE